MKRMYGGRELLSGNGFGNGMSKRCDSAPTKSYVILIKSR